MTYDFSIQVTYVAYVQNNGGKRRPVLVLYTLGHGALMHILPITSKYHHKSEAIKHQRYSIKHWKKSGLAKQSYIDISKPGTILAHSFHMHKIGRLDKADEVGLLKFIKHYYKTKH